MRPPGAKRRAASPSETSIIAVAPASAATAPRPTGGAGRSCARSTALLLVTQFDADRRQPGRPQHRGIARRGCRGPAPRCPRSPATATTSPARAPLRSTGARPSSEPRAVTAIVSVSETVRSPPSTAHPGASASHAARRPSASSLDERQPRVVRHGQRDQQRGRSGAHRRDVGEVHRRRLPAQVERRSTMRAGSPGRARGCRWSRRPARRERRSPRHRRPGRPARAEAPSRREDPAQDPPSRQLAHGRVVAGSGHPSTLASPRTAPRVAWRGAPSNRRSRRRGADLLAAALLTGCTTTVSLAARRDANDPACADVTVRLPGLGRRPSRAAGPTRRRPARGAIRASVILTCGVTPPAPTTLPCQHARRRRLGDRPVRGAALPRHDLGRTPAVEVYLDNERRLERRRSSTVCSQIVTGAAPRSGKALHCGADHRRVEADHAAVRSRAVSMSSEIRSA